MGSANHGLSEVRLSQKKGQSANAPATSRRTQENRHGRVRSPELHLDQVQELGPN